MGVYIKGMEIPECCGYCPFEYKNYCMAKPSLKVEHTNRHPHCPLVPVPSHGRLIDADKLADSFEPSDFWNPDAEDNCFAAVRIVHSAPTIIQAEDGKT